MDYVDLTDWDYRLVQTQYRNEWGELCDHVFIAKVEYEAGEPVRYIPPTIDPDDNTEPFEVRYKRIRAALTQPILKYNPETHKLVPFEP